MDVFAIAWLSVMAVAVAMTVEGARRGSLRLGLAKLVASAGFLALALHWGALDSTYGRAVVVAFALSAAGDALLISSGRNAFIAGLAAFLFAHIAFAAALITLEPALSIALRIVFWAAALAITLPLVGAVATWLAPHVPPAMEIPVQLYQVAIGFMLWLGLTVAATTTWVIGLAAVLFVISDLFVARHRFIQPSWTNRAIGLPLYYAAQVLFAWSVRLVG